MSSRKRTAIAIGSGRKRVRIGSAVKVKADPGRDASAVVETTKVSKASVKARFESLLSEPKYKAGAPNGVIQKEFSTKEDQRYLVEVINELSRGSRLQMSKMDNQLFYTLIDEEVAQKYIGLDANDRLVLQVIEKAGNKGIWTKEIRKETNMHPQPLNKIFKHLEQRRLIKPVKSVNAKAKKLYMLYDLRPSKEITGGVWYSGLEFDHEFISELRTFVIQCIKKLNDGKGVTMTEIKVKMRQVKVSKVDLTLEDVQQLVQTLVHDNLIEEGPLSNSGEVRYIAARRISTMCDFKWWDALHPDFHFRPIRFEDGVVLAAHELHHHTG